MNNISTQQSPPAHVTPAGRPWHSDSGLISIYALAARLDRFGVGALRFSLVVVLFWIGGLKFANYEADGIVPLVANSPLMEFFYHHSAPEYRQHMNRRVS